MIVTILAFVLVFGTIVFVHEFGHYTLAKRSGILVREFAIGMGPKLFSYRKSGTTYTLRILPLGGYVRMAGLEEDSEELKKGMVVSLILGENGKVSKINTSQKVSLMGGIGLELADWDLVDELYISGYENGNEDELKRYEVDHDALLVEHDGTEVQIAPKDVQFQSAPLISRMLTNFAGPFNNFILAIVAFALVAVLQGGVKTMTNTIASVQPNSVAHQAGIKVGDQLVEVAGVKTNDWTKLAQTISERPGKKTTVVVKRQSTRLKFELTPKATQVNGQKVGLIGITSKLTVNRSPLAIIGYGFKESWQVTIQVLAALKNMVTKGFNLDQLGGPVAMYSFTSQAAHYGLASVIMLLGLLSINLGIFNLLPIPALDGGKILLNIIEAIRGKPLDPNKEMIVTVAGFAFLLILMVLVTWNDIARYFLH